MIRTAGLEDLSALLVLEAQAFAGDRISRRSFRHLLTRAHALTLVDERDGGLAGYVLLLFRRGLSLARLYSIAVAPDWRGQGVASGLVTAAEHAALDHGCVLMRLEIRRDNAPSQALFVGLGYRPFGEISHYYEDAADARRYEKYLHAQPGAPVRRVPYYPQSLPFTCGPACLLMAMAAQDHSLRPDRLEELHLWREATTIYMSSGHGGCGPHGLALAAHRRGFDASLYLGAPGPLFMDSVRDPGKKAVMALVQEDFMAQCRAAGLAEHFGALGLDVLEACLRDGGLVLVLISSWRFYREKSPHWVVLSGMDERFCYIADPWLDEDSRRAPTDCLQAPVPRGEFERMARYGRANEQAAVVIGPRRGAR
ncbi:GNAT family N-acetyltransferase/peptidase C39 family protein [Alkalilimnicola sp. S0819]|uniref:GNAT family N-acetyltransferase/peptidase C39 family protein n=1 Tax=Alkalilimnicola sp. S0819 TaxID=2613922 RepID=UPI001262AC07|nr:GNAT family N-acetyltransferase/peptidase C39 family protein [Alkalilimnicola sp. S0819]KAB7624397.1 GNAT family N-acetyltransferase [Alkalilimnicola sp. S0819]MPQ16224.1 GNAT family N-acetyltransferase [Alkalilimnicola sp. S0819]